MIKGTHNYIYTLKASHSLGAMQFKGGQEFNIINNVVYMEGFPLPLDLQQPVLNWIKGKPELFNTVNREF